MNGLLVFLHLFGLMLGAAGGFGSGIVMRQAMSRPADQAQTLRSLGPVLANVAAAGVALLWITGPIMVWTMYGGFGNLPGLFWVKFLFVVVMTVLVGLTHMTYAEIRRTRNPAIASRLAIIGPASGVATLLAVLFAAYAFL
jgi:hypothetical protein